jgi:hypothetical protein
MAEVVGMDNSKKKRITHSECGAIIEYFPNEVTSKIENEPYGGGTDTYYYLMCPHCKKMIRWC